VGTINKNSPITPVLSDLIAVWQTANSDTRRTSLNEVLTLIQANLDDCTVNEPDTQYSAPSTTGFTVVIGDNDSDTHLILTPTATMATGAITLPTNTNLRDKQVLTVNTTAEVTTLTVNANGASAVNGAPTTMLANAYFTLKYDLTLNTWYRIG